MRSDVRMIQRGEDFGFPLEAGQSVRVGCDRRWQDLDGDLALQLRVRRAVDLAHAAFADVGCDFIEAESGAGSEGQRWRDYKGQRDRERDDSS